MRLIFTLSFFLLASTILPAQNLKGVWRGTFEQNTLEPFLGKFSKESYKYEVQINPHSNGALEGVTYSYLTTVFYGKASLKGIFDKKNKTLTIKETVLVEVKTTGKTEPCLMTCYLDYAKNGKLETLIGTYSSINMKTKADCGNGIVYLEKVEESDFEKEDFLKSTANNKKALPRKLPSGKNFEADRKAEENKITSVPKKRIVTPNSIVSKNKTVPTKPNAEKALIKTVAPKLVTKSINTNPIKKTKTKVENIAVKKEKPKSIDTIVVKSESKIDRVEEPINAKKLSAPIDDVLKERENKLANTIYVDSKDVTIEFYDNGSIDNDSISVYKDNKLVINNERLSTRPIVLNLKFDDFNTFYELITVAENLGDIPPNTALMVVNYGRKRQEVFLTSDEKRNAKVVIQYQGK